MSRTHRDGGSGSGWEKSERRHSRRRERMLEREFISRAKRDEDTTLSYDIEKPEPMWGRGWTGYWRPMRRWLASRLGQPWSKVYSELIAKLKQYSSTKDDLSIRRYITNMVEITPDPRFPGEYSYFRYDFYVDDTGILRQKKYMSHKREKHEKFDTRYLANWLNGRAVGKQGNKLYWFVPVSKGKKYRGAATTKWKCEWSSWYDSRYGRWGLRFLYLDYDVIKDKETGEVLERRPVWKQSHYPNLRQDKPLSKEEIEFWNRLPKHYQDQVFEWSPTNPTPPKSYYSYY